MKLYFLRRIREFLSRFRKREQLDVSFVFPYSADRAIKKQQILDNLQRGLLLEDKNILIPWGIPFNQLNRFKEKRRDSGDRTEWYFGRRTILDGYVCGLEVMMWMFLPWKNPITEIKVDLGQDYEGMENMHKLLKHISDKLEPPHHTDINKWGNLALGVIEWKFDKIRMVIVGIEHFAVRYSFRIGSTEDKNREYLNESVERLKAKGLIGDLGV